MNQRPLSVEDISNKLKPLFGNKIDELYFRYSVSESMEEKNQIVHVLGALYKKHLGKFLDKQLLLEPPTKEAVQGEYPLANVVYAGKELFPFSLEEHDWPRHVCISGMSGSGKTTLALNILNKFIEKDKPFLVFDWKKSFRSLMSVDSSLMCFTVGNDSVSNFFKTNINIPPRGVRPKEWINVLCDLLTESFSASFGVHKILLETLDEVFEGWEVYKGSKHYPNWQHIKKMLEIKSKEARGREATWYESALRIATVLTFGDFGKVINYDGKRNLSVEDLLDKKVVFELNSLGNIEKKFFSEFILTYIYKLKKTNQDSTEENFTHAILVDEAHNIFLKDKTHFVSESVTDMLYREMREYGTSLICLDQHVSKLSDTVKGNSACHIAFQQQLPQDVVDISNIMQLYDRKGSFSQLPVGSAIVKLSERFTSPFLIKVPYANLRKETITDERINQRMNLAVQGIEAEKEPEFMQEITKTQELPANVIKEESKKEVPSEEPYEITLEIPNYDISNKEIPSRIEVEIPKAEEKEIPKHNLTKVQNVLYEFAIEQLEKGKTLKEIEKLLESGISEKLYTQRDILVSINAALEDQFETEKEAILDNNYEIEVQPVQRVKQINETPKVELIESLPVQNNDSDNDHLIFLSFLENNPNHEYSTVELYKIMGFSARKGNKIKNELIERNLIQIHEQKYSNGWKKFIRLSNSYLPIKQNNITTNFK